MLFFLFLVTIMDNGDTSSIVFVLTEAQLYKSKCISGDHESKRNTDNRLGDDF